MKYYLIAGESSGDQYGALLMKELKELDPNAEFRFWGGDKMLEQSPNRAVSIEETSFMGLWVVLKNLFKIKALFRKAKKDIKAFKPDLLIHIDYPGFNLRLMKWAKNNGIKTCHLISPQIWAWRKYRYKTLRDYADLFYIVLPFEKQLYDSLGVKYEYYGHPILDLVKNDLHDFDASDNIRHIALFPGSRKQEVVRLVEIFIDFARSNKHIEFHLSKMDHIDKDIYLRNLKSSDSNIHLNEDLGDILNKADLAIACSGTISLELCLHNIPQIIVYKASPISYRIARLLVKTKYISLVNLVAGKELVKELIQDDCNQENLMQALGEIQSSQSRKQMIQEYQNLREELGDGNTMLKIAHSIHDQLKQTI